MVRPLTQWLKHLDKVVCGGLAYHGFRGAVGCILQISNTVSGRPFLLNPFLMYCRSVAPNRNQKIMFRCSERIGSNLQNTLHSLGCCFNSNEEKATRVRDPAKPYSMFQQLCFEKHTYAPPLGNRFTLVLLRVPRISPISHTQFPIEMGESSLPDNRNT